MFVVVDASPEALEKLGTSDAAIGQVLKTVSGGKGVSRLVVIVRLLPVQGWRAECYRQDGVITMTFAAGERYPMTAPDIYGWQWRFQTFQDHVATIFSHELFHYRQDAPDYSQSEQAGNVYALAHAQQCGYSVQAKRP